jgi:hypothetical protein
MSLRSRRFGVILLLPLVLVAAAAALTAAPDPLVASEWKTRDVQVDGRIEDWPRLTTIDNGPAVAAANDGEFLYLAVSATDPAMRRTLARGLVVWFDPANAKKMDFGVQLLGVREREDGERAATPIEDAPPASPVDALDMLGPGKARHLVPLQPALGVAAASAMDQGAIVFELKLPLASSPERAYAVGGEPGRTIALGLFTPEMPKESDGRRGGGMGRGGGGYGGGGMGGGYGGGMGGHRGGGYGGGGGERFGAAESGKPLKLWTKLQLAAAPVK